MGVIYSGQTISNSTLDGSTASNLATALETALAAAGWSLIQSGSSGSQWWRMRSVATPAGFQGDVWFFAVNSTTLNISMSATGATAYNVGSLQTSSTFTLACGSGNFYQLIATGFYFYLVRTAIPMPVQSFAFFGCPYLPSNLSGLITSFVVAYGDSTNQIGSTLGALGLFSTAAGAFCFLNGNGSTRASQWNLFGLTSYNQATWFDGSVEYYEPRVMAYQTNGSGQQTGSLRACGYLWDALVLNQTLSRGTQISYDSGTWLALSESINPTLLVKIG